GAFRHRPVRHLDRRRVHDSGDHARAVRYRRQPARPRRGDHHRLPQHRSTTGARQRIRRTGAGLRPAVQGGRCDPAPGRRARRHPRRHRDRHRYHLRPLSHRRQRDVHPQLAGAQLRGWPDPARAGGCRGCRGGHGRQVGHPRRPGAAAAAPAWTRITAPGQNEGPAGKPAGPSSRKPVRRSPLGERRNAAPAERYSAKAVGAARGHSRTGRYLLTPATPSLFPARGRICFVGERRDGLLARGGLLILLRVVPASAAVTHCRRAVAEGAIPLVRVRRGVPLGRVILPGVAVLAVPLARVGRSVRFLVTLVAVALVAVLLVAGLLSGRLLLVALIRVALFLVTLGLVALTLIALVLVTLPLVRRVLIRRVPVVLTLVAVLGVALALLGLVPGPGVAAVLLGTEVMTGRGVIALAGVRVGAVGLALIGLAGVVPTRVRGTRVRPGLAAVSLLAIALTRIALLGIPLVGVTLAGVTLVRVTLAGVALVRVALGRVGVPLRLVATVAVGLLLAVGLPLAVGLLLVVGLALVVGLLVSVALLVGVGVVLVRRLGVA